MSDERASTTPETALEPILPCPVHLMGIAREEWNRVVNELTALGVLSRFDMAALAVYCACYALWVEAMDGLQKFGIMMKSPTGYPVQSPYVAIANKQAEMIVKLAIEFGFTPAARFRSFGYERANSMRLVPDAQGNGLSGELQPL